MAGRSRQNPPAPSGRGRPEIPWPRAKKPVPDRETIRSLQERAKELNCLYQVDEILGREGVALEQVFAGIIAVIPAGWKYPAACQARIVWHGRSFASPGYVDTEWRLTAPIHQGHAALGLVEVSYTAELEEADAGPFLKEEVRLINAVAERISTYLRHRQQRGEAE